MDKAKAAVSSFLSKDGKHQTSVDQDVKPAVTEEHVNPHQHENVTTAIDREVHKDHHYTTVQPVTAKEQLPEQHHHNIIPVEHKSIDHGGKEELQSTLDRDAAQYQSTSTTHDTTHSQSTVPVVAGERVHHHVHEHVQPVIQKEVVEPHVVHTTIPIHETHTAAPVHHGTKVAPTKTLDEFVSGGGNLGGATKKELFDYEGCPETEKSASHTHSHTGAASTAAAAAGAAGAGGIAGSKHHDHNTSTRDRDINDTTSFGTSTRDRDVNNTSSLGTSTRDRDVNDTSSLGTSTRDRDVNDTSSFGTSDNTTSKPSVTDKVKGALSGQSVPNEQREHHDTHDKREGAFFGKDKIATENTSTSATGASTTNTSNVTGSRDHDGITKDEHYKHGVTGADTFATDRVNDEGAFGGPGSVPRSDVNTTTGQSSSEPLQSWHAGETHKDIAGDVHKAGQEHRASLLDKINPFKDSDGDGQKGFMK